MQQKSDAYIKIENWVNETGDRWLTEGYNKIAEELGLNDSVVYDQLPNIVAAKEGCTVEDVQERKRKASQGKFKQPISPEIVDRILELTEAGRSVQGIAAELNISASTVRRYLKKHKEQNQPAKED